MILLLTASFTYLLLELPYVIYILIMRFIRSLHILSHDSFQFFKYTDYKIIDDRGEDHGEYLASMYLWYSISISFMYINNSIKFYLYCLGGSTFREEFLTMMNCCKPQKARDIEMTVNNLPEGPGKIVESNENGNYHDQDWVWCHITNQIQEESAYLQVNIMMVQFQEIDMGEHVYCGLTATLLKKATIAEI